MSYRFICSHEASSMRTIPSGSHGTDRRSKSYESNHRQRSYSSETFSSNAESTDEYEQCDPRLAAPRPCVRTVVRAATPPPIFKRVFERAPTPDAPVMERIIIRPKAQRIIERVIEQPWAPQPPLPFRSSRLEADIHWERRPAILQPRLHTQPSLFYGQPCRAMPSFAHRMISTASGGYRAHPMVDPRTPMTTFQNLPSSNRSYSSTSSFECVPSEPATPAVTSPTASSNVIPHPSVFQPIMYQPMQLPSAVPSYVPPYFIPFVLQRMLFAYGPILTAGGIIPTISGFVNVPTSGYSSQLSFHPLITQQLAY